MSRELKFEDRLISALPRFGTADQPLRDDPRALATGGGTQDAHDVVAEALHLEVEQHLTGERLECRLAAALGGENIPGFGCSDCDCASHLLFRCTNPIHEVEDAFRRTGLVPLTATIMSRQDSKGKL